MKTLFNTIAFLLFLVLGICGCSCGVDVKPAAVASGSANVVINGLDGLRNAAQNQYVSVTFTGTVVKNDDGSGATSFSVTQEFEITPSGNVTPGTSLPRVDLQPGNWSVTARANSWTSTCSGDIPKGKSTSFVFTYNAAGCAIQ